MTDTPRVTVPVEWHREDADHCRLIYSLMQKGWRKGQPVMVNDVAIRVEACNGSETDIGPIADAIQAALSAAPAPEGGAVDHEALAKVGYEASCNKKWEWASRGCKVGWIDAVKAIIAALATREEAPANTDECPCNLKADDCHPDCPHGREEAPAGSEHPCYDEHQPGCDCVIPAQKAAPVPSFLERMTAPAEAGEVLEARARMFGGMVEVSNYGGLDRPQETFMADLRTLLRAQPPAREGEGK